MTGRKRSKTAPHSSPVAPGAEVPAAYVARQDIPAGGTISTSVTVDSDFELHHVGAKATGPAIVTIRVIDPGHSGAAHAVTCGESFEEYLRAELPGHLAAMVEEDPTHWEEQNHRLQEQAAAGDDTAFFELLARDPRQIASPLTLRRVLTWQTRIGIYAQHYRYKASQLWNPPSVIEEARRGAEQARDNLQRIGRSQLVLYDQRGKRPLPPPGSVRGIYYGLLCLLQGLRALHSGVDERARRVEVINACLSDFLHRLCAVEVQSDFLEYVVAGAHLVLGACSGPNATPLYDLVSLPGESPSTRARQLTAKVFETSEDTVERFCSQEEPIPLRSSHPDQRLLVGRPSYKLFGFPEVAPLRPLLAR